MGFCAPSFTIFEKKSKLWFNDCLWKTCNKDDGFTDCTTEATSRGKLVAGLANPSAGTVQEIDAGNRKTNMTARYCLISLKNLSNDVKFDHVFFGASPELQYSSINEIITADLVLLIITVDESDTFGTCHMIKDVYDQIEKKTGIIISKMPFQYSSEATYTRLMIICKSQQMQNMESLPRFCVVLSHGRKSLFTIENPHRPFTLILQKKARAINESVPDQTNDPTDLLESTHAHKNEAQSPSSSSPFKIQTGKVVASERKPSKKTADASMTRLENPKISRLQRLLLRLGGAISLGIQQPPGYAPTEFYLRRCRKHGIVKTYPQGFEGELKCGRCLVENK
jgi:hypothetical protein